MDKGKELRLGNVAFRNILQADIGSKNFYLTVLDDFQINLAYRIASNIFITTYVIAFSVAALQSFLL